MKNNLDERQELKLLKIEHNACWLSFWGLVIVLIIQKILGNDSINNIGGELVILLVLSIYIGGACIKNGLWSRHGKPNLKSNVTYSVLAGIIVGLIWFIISYRNYHRLIGSIATFAFMFLLTLFLCFIVLKISSQTYEKRFKKLEEFDEDSIDNK